MNFEIVFRGYDRDAVDKYIRETEETLNETLSLQKERIFSLVEENNTLKEQVKQYKIDEQAIGKSLVESQKLALELKNDAEKFAQITLSRAKIFYATWQAYAKTLINALTDEEVKQFNALSEKIEHIINSYEGKTDNAETEWVRDGNFDVKTAASAAAVPSQKTREALENRKYINPVEKIEQAAGRIDLKELLKPEESLEELCRDLGLTGGKR